MHECLNYKKRGKNKIECYACSHRCRILEGGTGICGVRQNKQGKLQLLVYGKAVAVHLDPVEKKPLFHFWPGSLAYSVGTLGCNFRCANCQNFDISQMFGYKGRVKEYSRLNWGYKMSPQEIVEEALAGSCRSVAYTYNEPTIWLEYALDTMKLARQKGLKNIWVSNGFMSGETLDLIIPYLDAINVDIKSFSDEFYRNNCGAYLDPVLKNCQRLAQEGVWTEITTLVIPTLSDNLEMLAKIAGFIKEKMSDFVPWHISAFSGAISWKLKHLPDTPVEVIKKAYKIGKEAGLKYVYAGNIFDSDLESTYCPRCGRFIIKRIGYQTIRYDKRGKCQCGEIIEGVFEE